MNHNDQLLEDIKRLTELANRCIKLSNYHSEQCKALQAFNKELSVENRQLKEKIKILEEATSYGAGFKDGGENSQKVIKQLREEIDRLGAELQTYIQRPIFHVGDTVMYRPVEGNLGFLCGKRGKVAAVFEGDITCKFVDHKERIRTAYMVMVNPEELILISAKDLI